MTANNDLVVHNGGAHISDLTALRAMLEVYKLNSRPERVMLHPAQKMAMLECCSFHVVSTLVDSETAHALPVPEDIPEPKLCGIQVQIDRSMPEDEIRLVDGDGKAIVTIKGLAIPKGWE